MKWKDTFHNARLVVGQRLRGSEVTGRDDNFLRSSPHQFNLSKYTAKSLDSLDQSVPSDLNESEEESIDSSKLFKQTYVVKSGRDVQRQKNSDSDDDDGGFVNSGYVPDSGDESARKLTAAVSGKPPNSFRNVGTGKSSGHVSVVANSFNFQSVCSHLPSVTSRFPVQSGKIFAPISCARSDTWNPVLDLHSSGTNNDTVDSNKSSSVTSSKDSCSSARVENFASCVRNLVPPSISASNIRNSGFSSQLAGSVARSCEQISCVGETLEGEGFVFDDGDAPPRKMVMVEFCTYGGSFLVLGGDDEARSRYINMKLHDIAASGGTGKRVLVVVSLAGVKVCDAEGKRVLMAHALRRISYATCDPQRQCFSFLARAPRDCLATQSCHSFLTTTPQQVSGTMHVTPSVLLSSWE
ncbi:PTB/PI domain [Trinorchestia longiramus]|nr:PTB/PI domain [Trinorchestia longiramus]